VEVIGPVLAAIGVAAVVVVLGRRRELSNPRLAFARVAPGRFLLVGGLLLAGFVAFGVAGGEPLAAGLFALAVGIAALALMAWLSRRTD
jgi:hypothetical protein